MGHSLSELTKLGRVLKSRRAGVVAMAALVVAVLYKAFSGQLQIFSPSQDYVAYPELGGGRFPQYSLFTSSFVNSIWPLILAGLVLFLLTLRLSTTIANASKKHTLAESVDDQESGSSAVEFVMVLPALAALLLMTLQIALIVQAKFVVNYAAFCAARSAIVIIPDDIAGGPREPRNRLANPEVSEKVEIIRRAAALPLTAISPLPGLSVSRGVPVLANPDAFVELLKLAPFDVGPRSMVAQVTLRAPYAYHDENTAVKVLTQEGAEGGSYQDHDWVTVKVQYRYYLAVPFAKKLFGTSYSGNPVWNLVFGTDYYYPIVEQYTLPMDGEPSGPDS